MSRGRGNRCSKMQTAESSLPQEGASLLLELTEDEYQFDVCPMSWDDGRNPYANPAILDVYADGSALYPFLGLLIMLTSVHIFYIIFV
ncbi:unnamed protein product [Trichobilharzia regenti]|nr:unnamed protein product [Trichobilharzia regenti]